jgi:hypothetical protein
VAWAIGWMLIGALIGVAAANSKGFSLTTGVIGGLLLGILSPLMFFISTDRKKCPFCAGWIKMEAVVCPRCQRDQPASPVGHS